jgi:DNA-directed RNA polymerase specialized sigma24 family protein
MTPRRIIAPVWMVLLAAAFDGCARLRRTALDAETLADARASVFSALTKMNFGASEPWPDMLVLIEDSDLIDRIERTARFEKLDLELKKAAHRRDITRVLSRGEYMGWVSYAKRAAITWFDRNITRPQARVRARSLVAGEQTTTDGRLRRAMEHLTPAQVNLLHDRFVLRRSLAEMAQTRNISRSALHRTLHDTLDLLAKVFDDTPDTPST